MVIEEDLAVCQGIKYHGEAQTHLFLPELDFHIYSIFRHHM